MSKFRGLHNHPLELGCVYSEFEKVSKQPAVAPGPLKRFNDDKEIQGRYEGDALEDILIYDTKKIDKVGKYLLKMRN